MEDSDNFILYDEEILYFFKKKVEHYRNYYMKSYTKFCNIKLKILSIKAQFKSYSKTKMFKYYCDYKTYKDFLTQRETTFYKEVKRYLDFWNTNYFYIQGEYDETKKKVYSPELIENEIIFQKILKNIEGELEVFEDYLNSHEKFYPILADVHFKEINLRKLVLEYKIHKKHGIDKKAPKPAYGTINIYKQDEELKETSKCNKCLIF